jgi:hypothetical protein
MLGSCPLRLLLAWCLRPHQRLINIYLLCTFVTGDDRCAELRAGSLCVMRRLSVMGGLGARSHVNWQEEGEEEEAPVFEPGFDIGSRDAAPAIHGI